MTSDVINNKTRLVTSVLLLYIRYSGRVVKVVIGSSVGGSKRLATC